MESNLDICTPFLCFFVFFRGGIADSSQITVRRKFLRQNRDLARINSNQSSRIRLLDSQYACLLSENLDLRAQVLRLQKELENDTTRRVADQAMEIKARMEAKLAELGDMLATFGDEPPAKRHSPERRKFINASPRSVRKTAQRKPRENVDQDALAAQEGRLPPIYESKSVARATMKYVCSSVFGGEDANFDFVAAPRLWPCVPRQRIQAIRLTSVPRQSFAPSMRTQPRVHPPSDHRIGPRV